jgi:hypothetical protein
MSMRIQNDGLAGPAVSQAAPADKAEQAGSSALSRPAANSGGDQVDLSSFSGNFSASIGALAEQQAARVTQLSALYGRGEYSADSMQVSRALVSSAIAGGSLAGEN